MSDEEERRTSKLAALPIALSAAAWGIAGLTGTGMVFFYVISPGSDPTYSIYTMLLGSLGVGALAVASLAFGGAAFLRVQVQQKELRGRGLAAAGMLAAAGALAVAGLPVLLGIAGFVLIIALLSAGGGPHGRPLRGVRFRTLVPVGLSRRPRRLRRAAAWAASCVAEHESVEAFEDLARDLEGHRAPADLVARARRAAEQERVHAARCALLVERYSGVAVRPVSIGLPDAGAPRPKDLATIARESVEDGVIGEGDAARRAADEAVVEPDPVARDTLLVIARDEAEHAALGADIAAWATAAARPPMIRSAAPE